VLDNGAFNVGLGEVASLDSLSFDQPYYLGLQVAGDADEMAPRQKLGSSAHSLGSLSTFALKQRLEISGTGNTDVVVKSTSGSDLGGSYYKSKRFNYVGRFG
jgi:hypothetical protein